MPMPMPMPRPMPMPMPMPCLCLCLCLCIPSFSSGFPPFPVASHPQPRATVARGPACKNADKRHGRSSRLRQMRANLRYVAFYNEFGYISMKNRENPSLGPLMPPRRSLGALGGLLGPPGGLMGASWDHLGASCDHLASSWGQLGASWEPPRTTWAPPGTT